MKGPLLLAIGLFVAVPAQLMLVASLAGSTVLRNPQMLFVWGLFCLAANALVYVGADSWALRRWPLPSRSPGS
jgi:hypothetical protein